MKLAQLTNLIRSKNAGPFSFTFDIMFPDEKSYLRVKQSGVLNVSLFAKLYRCDPGTVLFFECDNALAFKFSIPRPVVQGELGDGDLHGGQQFMPLVDVEIP
jgi:hypothetical protein